MKETESPIIFNTMIKDFFLVKLAIRKNLADFETGGYTR